MICQLNKNHTSCFYLVETKKIDEHLFVYEGHCMPTASIISWRKEVLKGIKLGLDKTKQSYLHKKVYNTGFK